MSSNGHGNGDTQALHYNSGIANSSTQLPSRKLNGATKSETSHTQLNTVPLTERPNNLEPAGALHWDKTYGATIGLLKHHGQQANKPRVEPCVQHSGAGYRYHGD